MSTSTHQVGILLLNEAYMSEIYFAKDPVASAKNLLLNGWYRRAHEFTFDCEESVEAAEEAFVMTNDPSRSYERDKYYGRQRSVSVGDVVDVDGELMLCAASGWELIGTVRPVPDSMKN